MAITRTIAKFTADVQQNCAMVASLAFTNSDGSPFDLTGITLSGQFRTTAEYSATPLAEATFTVATPASGIAIMGLSAHDAGLLPANSGKFSQFTNIVLEIDGTHASDPDNPFRLGEGEIRVSPGGNFAPATATAPTTPLASISLVVGAVVPLAKLIEFPIATRNVKDAPYSASGSAFRTTVIGTLASGSTVVPVTSAGDFVYGQGVCIPGAGVAGANYVGVVAAIGTGQITISPATNTTVTSGTVTTATTGTNSPGMAINIASSAGLAAGQGISIAGAGKGGALYLGWVRSVGSGTVRVSPPIATLIGAGAVVTSVALVQHDDTAAIQSAMTDAAAAGGGKVFCPTGFYRVNGPIQDTTNAKCLLRVPTVVYSPVPLPGSPPIALEIEGPCAPCGVAFCFGEETSGGAVIQSDVNYPTGSVFGGYSDTAGSYGHLTSVWAKIRKLTVRTHDDPMISGVNAIYLGSNVLEDVQIDTGVQQVSGQITFSPTNGLVFGYSSPGSSSALLNSMHRVAIQGYANGAMLHEHVFMNDVYFSFNYNAMNVQTTFACSGAKVTVDKAAQAVTGTGTINIAHLTCDQIDYLVNGTSDMSGSLTYKLGSGTAYINNGSGMKLFDLSTGAKIIPGNLSSRGTVTFTPNAVSGLTASTVKPSVAINMTASKTWAAGALADQADVLVSASTHAFASASTETNPATFAISGPPIVGANGTQVNPLALWVKTGLIQSGTLANTSNVTTDLKLVGRNNGANGIFARLLLSQTTDLGAFFAAVNAWRSGDNNGCGVSISTNLRSTFGATAITPLTINDYGAMTLAPVNVSGTAASTLTVTCPAHTSLTTTVENISINFNTGATKTWAAGAIATQRETLFQAPTYAFGSASTITTAATVAITGAPAAGANATITNSHALWVQAGTVRVATLAGTGSRTVVADANGVLSAP